MPAVIRLLFQLLLVDSRIVLEPKIVDRPLRISRGVNVRMNVRRRGPMRIRTGPDRAKLVFSILRQFYRAGGIRQRQLAFAGIVAKSKSGDQWMAADVAGGFSVAHRDKSAAIKVKNVSIS